MYDKSIVIERSHIMKNICLTPNFRLPKGKIKPMHGINNAPFTWANCGMFHYLAEAGIPYARLHDTGGMFGGGIYVDIDNVFPNFDADPNDPASYEFAFTDHLLKELLAVGVEPFYRLGCTIENYQKSIAPRRIFPPKDSHKWAVICEHIIRHINEGWGNGYHMGVTYWEIWNEPDNEPDPQDNPMWRGSMEEFFTLYEVTANHLKNCFPHLKIGGYASCGFYEILNMKSAESANVSSRTGYFIEFFEKFLMHITSAEHKAPLDFFSWHSYADMNSNIQFAKYAREMLDKYGLMQAESILNEWNPSPLRRGTMEDAALIASMFIAMQNSPVDMLSYYDGQLQTTYGGMFNPLTLTPFKAFYAFKAFNMLYELGTQYALVGEMSDGQLGHGVYALAAQGSDGKAAMMLVNMEAQVAVTMACEGAYELSLLDEVHDLTVVETLQEGDVFVLPTHGVAVLKAL